MGIQAPEDGFVDLSASGLLLNSATPLVVAVGYKRSAVHQGRRGVRWTSLLLVHRSAGIMNNASALNLKVALIEMLIDSVRHIESCMRIRLERYFEIY